ncbi:MAG: MFS transporter [Flavobacteriales bacterium]
MSETITKGDKKLIRSWAFYDWANSAYPLVITTAIFPIFYENVTRTDVKDELGNIIGHSDTVTFWGHHFHNTELYSYVVGLSFILVSLFSPILSGVADYTGRKKLFMRLFCYLGAISCASLYFFNNDYLGLSLLSVFFASIGFWGSLVFYNAYLPEIAEPEDHDSISALGFGLGYLGSSILLIINLVLIQAFEMNARWAFVTVAIWWIGFAHLSFARLPKGQRNGEPRKNILTNGFHELGNVWKELKHHKQLKRFLASFFIYSMGVQTVMLMAVLFAKKEIEGLEESSLIISVLIIQFLGILGSFLFSRTSRMIGNIKTLGIALFLWVCICAGTYQFVYSASGFYIVAASVGLVMGGIQSLSRSTYSKLLPETDDHASFFSFYDVAEKVGIVIGMFSFGFIEGITGGMRNSILALVIFFVIGFLILLTIPKSKHVN